MNLETELRKVLEQLKVDTSSISEQKLKEIVSYIEQFTMRCPNCKALAGTFWNYCLQCGVFLPARENQTKTEKRLRQEGCKIPHNTLKQEAKYCSSCGKDLHS